uniref:Uncharacterized protein n=1 Tax=Arundo donax TaxID=35708 RepID=A0A0A8YWY9_ARUDO
MQHKSKSMKWVYKRHSTTSSTLQVIPSQLSI